MLKIFRMYAGITSEVTCMRDIVLYITMWIVTITMYVSYVPQIYKLIKTKKSEDLSVNSWILWVISSTADTIYSCVLGRPELMIASISEAVLNVTVLLLTIKYSGRLNNKRSQS